MRSLIQFLHAKQGYPQRMRFQRRLYETILSVLCYIHESLFLFCQEKDITISRLYLRQKTSVTLGIVIFSDIQVVFTVLFFVSKTKQYFFKNFFIADGGDNKIVFKGRDRPCKIFKVRFVVYIIKV